MMETLQQGYGISQGYPGTMGVGVPQIGQQGLWGNPQAAPFGGLLSSGIGGLFGSQNVPRQINGIGGIFAGLDPVTAAYAQQAQLAQLLQQTQLGHPQTQGIFGNPLQNVDPVTAAYLQQTRQITPQLGAQLFGGQQFGGQQFGIRPVGVDPLTVACLQQAQLVQQQVQLAQLLHQAQLAQQLQQQQQYGGFGGHQFGQPGRISPFQGIGQQLGGNYGQGIPWQ